ncbi:MAG TPA: nuclear transport factor 2 family protein [Phenylobacterium sp.]
MIVRTVLAVAASLALMTSMASAAPKPANANEEVALKLLDTAFNQKKPDEAFAKYVGPTYRQHNPTVADGKEAIVEALHKWLPPELHYEIVRVISSGDLVAVHAHVTIGPQDRGMAVVDIFRIENGKVAEHWDVSQPVPEKASNDNTMF